MAEDQNELIKKLEEVVNETISEVEELKKSRYSAETVKMEGPGGKMSGHPSNGSMNKEEDEEDEDEDERDEEEDEEEGDEAEKAEGKNSEADPGRRGVTPPDEADVPSSSDLNSKAQKSEDSETKRGRQPQEEGDVEEKHKKDEANKAEGKNSEADPGRRGAVKPDEASEPQKSDLNQKAKKSLDEDNSLTKSYVDSRIDELEKKVSTVLDTVKQISDQPVTPKGVTSNAVPLKKSEDEGAEPLNKSQVTQKLWELKKSGETDVSTDDIISVEIGSADLQSIANKYGLK